MVGGGGRPGEGGGGSRWRRWWMAAGAMVEAAAGPGGKGDAGAGCGRPWRAAVAAGRGGDAGGWGGRQPVHAAQGRWKGRRRRAGREGWHGWERRVAQARAWGWHRRCWAAGLGDVGAAAVVRPLGGVAPRQPGSATRQCSQARARRDTAKAVTMLVWSVTSGGGRDRVSVGRGSRGGRGRDVTGPGGCCRSTPSCGRPPAVPT